MCKVDMVLITSIVYLIRDFRRLPGHPSSMVNVGNDSYGSNTTDAADFHFSNKLLEHNNRSRLHDQSDRDGCLQICFRDDDAAYNRVRRSRIWGWYGSIPHSSTQRHRRLL